jgi:DNA-binding LacI/PurR family transcriptional regulator
MRPRAQAAPLYQGIIDDLRQRIADGRLAPGDQAPTQGELCREFGVSPITAKRAMADLQKAGLLYTVKGRGTFVARRLQPAPVAPGVRPRLHAIGLVTSSYDAVKARSFFTEIWQSVEQAAQQQGLSFRVQILPDATPDEHVQLLFKPDPGEGLVFMASSRPYRVLPIVVEQAVPMVMIDSALPFASCVLTDNYDGMRQIIDHLMACGHRRVGLASWHPRSPNATNENERVAAFEFIARLRNLQWQAVPSDDPQAIARASRGRKGISAVVFTQDDPALDFVEWARGHGLKVPEQLSVTGFDGWAHARTGLDLDLSTLAVDRGGLGRAAVELLRSPELPDSLHSRWVRVPGRLHLGQTVADCPCP